MTMGTTTQAYGESRYWDNRYANESESFDWYQKYQSLAPLINLYVPRHPNQHNRILVVGCGNSGAYSAFSLQPHSPDQMIQISHLIHTQNSKGIGFQNAAFSEGMADDGYEDVVSIDISSVVIQTMQSKYSNRPHLKYLQMDVRDMSAFETASFDAVVDKGTLDSLLCGSNSRQNATEMLEEVWRYKSVSISKCGCPKLLVLFIFLILFTHHILKRLITTYRVLKDKGVYFLVMLLILFYSPPTISIYPPFPRPAALFFRFLVTYGAPLYRLRLLRESCSWMIKLHVIEKLSCEDKPEPPMWDLTNPVPLHGDGSSAEELLGNNPDVHYIYICTKDNSLKPGVKREPSVD
ncbi:unnamed protein product [Malus baccata var. baccata]